MTTVNVFRTALAPQPSPRQLAHGPVLAAQKVTFLCARPRRRAQSNWLPSTESGGFLRVLREVRAHRVPENVKIVVAARGPTHLLRFKMMHVLQAAV